MAGPRLDWRGLIDPIDPMVVTKLFEGAEWELADRPDSVPVGDAGPPGTLSETVRVRDSMSGFVDRARFRRDHRWVPARMSDYVEEDLGGSRRTRMERHLRECEECRRLLAGLRRTLELLHRPDAGGDRVDALRMAAAVRARLHEPGWTVLRVWRVKPDMNNETYTQNPTGRARVEKTDGEWRGQLTADQYDVLRRKGTERAFTGKYFNEKRAGTYRCAGCGAELFSSETKFDSGTGWPSFTEPADRANVKLHDDFSYGMRRIEVTCAACDGHLGHVFPDGPGKTGERFCINSCSLELEERQR
jgi:peptide-methionine (R)-S-oxide reductase